jgi:protein-disulfide isomerase
MFKWCKSSGYILITIVLLSPIHTVFAQTSSSDLRQELDEIKQNQQVMQKDLAEIKALLSRLTAQQPVPQQPPPQVNIKGVEFDTGGNPVLGNESAKLILVEFTDYQCPFCGRYARETFPKIKERYIDKGMIRYAAIDQPLPMHPEAAKAAEASHCAEEQGKFWEMHEEMMANQETLKDLSSYARILKLNIGQFENCLNTGKYKDAVNKDMELANKLGVNGVPGFIIGTVDENDPGKVTGISMIRGAMPFDNFQNELDAALRR